MVAMYTGLFVFLAAWAPRGVGGPFPWGRSCYFLLPMALDGGTHFLSDLSGFGQGFRDTNLWLSTLTASRLPPGFYAGDAWGSFNATMRLATGVLFGLAVVWFAVPRIGLRSTPADEVEAASLRRSAAQAGLRSRLEPVYNSNDSEVHPAADLPAGRVLEMEVHEMAIDLVCGMEVEEKTGRHVRGGDGKTYYFCAAGCKRSFDQDQRKYIDQATPPPMHHTHHG